jgi:hypothetical protein
MKKQYVRTFSVQADQDTFLIRHPQFAAGMRVGSNVYHVLYAAVPQIADADLLEVQRIILPFDAAVPLHAGILFGWMNAFYAVHGRMTFRHMEFAPGWIFASESLQHLSTLDSDLELTSFLHDFLNGKTALSQEMEMLEARIGYVCATIAGLLEHRKIIERMEGPTITVDPVNPCASVFAGQEVA